MAVETIKNQETITQEATMNAETMRPELFAGLDWNEIVQQIDEILDAEGSSAVQEVPARGGRTLYGYKPQNVIDALNQVVGATNWGYQIIESNIVPVESKKGETRYLSYVRIRLWIIDPSTAKEAFGGSENYTPGDSLKGAVTDAIQKALSLFSVGRKAYRGELHVYFDKKPSKQKKSNNGKASEKQIALIKRLAEKTGATIKVDLENISSEKASKIIEKLLAKKKELEAKDSIDEISNVEF